MTLKFIKYEHQCDVDYLTVVVTPNRFMAFFGAKEYTTTFAGDGMTWFDKLHPHHKPASTSLCRKLMFMTIRNRPKIK